MRSEPEDNFGDGLRVLVVAPTGRDARLICDLLDRANIHCSPCGVKNLSVSDVSSNTGALIMAEEALSPRLIADLTTAIANQPGWSDFPLVLLTFAGVVSRASQRRSELRGPLGNVLLLERPIRPETLISTVHSALRARRRQYQIRDQWEQFKKAEEALRQSEKLAVAGRLTATIAHEINNPLAAVTNLHFLMRNSNSIEEIKSYLALAEQEQARVSEIARQTLQYYRRPDKPAPVNVTEVIESIMRLYQPRLLAAGIAIKTDYQHSRLIVAVAGELRQLFANFIGNALDAMWDGGTLRIRVRDSRELSNGMRSGVRVVIADNGSGIPEEVKARIFEPFVSTKGDKGTGLGLWVSREIVEKHKGVVKVKSSTRPGMRGTAFSVFLPAGTGTSQAA